MRRVFGQCFALCLSLCLATLLGPTPGHAQNAVCAEAPPPVVRLAHGSRYQAADKSRSVLDAASNAEVNRALAPVEEFLRALARESNAALRAGTDPAKRRAQASCVLRRMASWAEGNALSDLETMGAQFAVGSRLAAFGMIYLQLRPYAAEAEDEQLIANWLLQRARAQARFWEQEAPPGAARGNLRAWATLGITLAAIANQDRELLDDAAAAAARLQCEAAADGSLPQEMKRGKYALHYQLHAVAPMVTTTLLLEQQGNSIRGVCNNALQRIARFAFDDLETGARSAAHAGVKQSYFDGTETLHKYELAWIEPYLILHYDAEMDRFASDLRPFSHSKLGGNQDLVWGRSF
ncbi:alginate lyase family protein [Cognatishimia sp. SS12]|uniref:alginate lyase family protein n=1 Tax=Cognatishimia sp. SS12 TaxID=2979465 RepID=UPI00232FF74B|nr:alginate lyase family protein [Cognatishimia sp. SS12]MDC0738699.1 alginate lyase family protein [Cognatishimia sp. SS12]